MNFDALVCDARAHYENFPVASLVLPKSMRRHVAAVYAFARTADDFADEGSLPDHTRHVLLDGWLRRLEDAASTGGAGAPLVSGEPANSLEIFAALGATIRECKLPVSLFAGRISRRPGTPLGTRSSITVAGRRTRWAASCFASPGVPPPISTARLMLCVRRCN
jgi:hypothetical protein